MFVYDRAYFGEDKTLAEKSFLETMSALEKAKKSFRSFFFISSSSVFDRKTNRQYEEGDLPNSGSPSSLFLIEAEKNVLDYQNGHVLRKQDILSELTPVFDRMTKYEGVPTFSNESFRILSDSLYSQILEYAVSRSFGNHKILHLALPTEFPVYDIWYSITGKEFRIGTNTTIEFEGNVGFIKSSILDKLSFYDSVLRRNKKEVLQFFNNMSISNGE